MTNIEHQNKNGEWVDCNDAVGRCKLPKRKKQASGGRGSKLGGATTKQRPSTPNKAGITEARRYLPQLSPELSKKSDRELAEMAVKNNSDMNAYLEKNYNLKDDAERKEVRRSLENLTDAYYNLPPDTAHKAWLYEEGDAGSKQYKEAHDTVKSLAKK